MLGVVESIHFFKSNGFKIGLATSSPNIILNAILDTLKIRDLFDVVTSAENLVYGKPHPEVYINTAKDLGVQTTSCIAIEDSFNGLLSAKSARMKTIAVPENENRNKTEFMIADIILDNLYSINRNHLDQLSVVLT